MEYRIQTSPACSLESDHESDFGADTDWVSYSGSSTHDDDKRKTQHHKRVSSTILKPLRLTSSVLRHRKQFKSKIFGNKKRGTNDSADGGGAPGRSRPAAVPVPVSAPNALISSGVAPLQQHPSNTFTLSSQSSLGRRSQTGASNLGQDIRARAPRLLPFTRTKGRQIQHGDNERGPKVFLLPPHSLTSSPRLPSNAHVWSETTTMDPNHPASSPNLADLLTSLSSPEDANRKMAAFKLQSLINDPSFAEHFVLEGGLPRLRTLVLESSGNTLAYSLASFARLLEVDQGWEAVNDKVVEKVSDTKMSAGWTLSFVNMEH
jgi:hypothetical protein